MAYFQYQNSINLISDAKMKRQINSIIKYAIFEVTLFKYLTNTHNNRYVIRVKLVNLFIAELLLGHHPNPTQLTIPTNVLRIARIRHQ